MRFEARELPPYAEYAATEDLRDGAVYFYVRFIDNAMLIPYLEPVVFIGRDLDPDDLGTVYFQDAASYQAGIRVFTGDDRAPTDEDMNAVLYSLPAENGHVFEYEKAVDVLLRCALKRSEVAGSGER